MRLKKLFLSPLKGYQYISKMLPASCRYYPTCSEYAKWQFEVNRSDKALLATTLRILRCNQLFEGGIDYPLIAYTPPHLLALSLKSIPIKYWLIPQEDGKRYHLIKDYGAFEPTP